MSNNNDTMKWAPKVVKMVDYPNQVKPSTKPLSPYRVPDRVKTPFEVMMENIHKPTQNKKQTKSIDYISTFDRDTHQKFVQLQEGQGQSIHLQPGLYYQINLRGLLSAGIIKSASVVGSTDIMELIYSDETLGVNMFRAESLVYIDVPSQYVIAIADPSGM